MTTAPNEPVCPFALGSEVTWTDDAPKTWRFIFTDGPMRVTDARYHDGKPNEYAIKLTKGLSNNEKGLDIRPGWIVAVEYNADSQNPTYYYPPLSLIFQKQTLQIEIHQMWLRPL